MTTSHKKNDNSASSEKIIELLRTQGFRITKIRQAMLEIFTATRKPRSVQEILATIALKHPTVNKTTIYRELEFLTTNSIVNEIDILDGMKRYELHESGHHHHHLVCNECKEIQCVEVPHHDLDALENRINKSHKFKITSHVLEFFGLCQNCLS